MITSAHTGFEFVLPILFHGYTLRMRGFELDHYVLGGKFFSWLVLLHSLQIKHFCIC